MEVTSASEATATLETTADASTPAAQTQTCGWQKDDKGWWYLNSDGTHPKSQWMTIEEKDYCFNEEGYLYVNTITPDGCHVDENGVRVRQHH